MYIYTNNNFGYVVNGLIIQLLACDSSINRLLMATGSWLMAQGARPGPGAAARGWGAVEVLDSTHTFSSFMQLKAKTFAKI